MGSEGLEDIIRHTVATSRNGCLKARNKSRVTRGIALDGEYRCDVWHGRLIITPGETEKEEELRFVSIAACYHQAPSQTNVAWLIGRCRAAYSFAERHKPNHFDKNALSKVTVCFCSGAPRAGEAPRTGEAPARARAPSTPWLICHWVWLSPSDARGTAQRGPLEMLLKSLRTLSRNIFN